MIELSARRRLGFPAMIEVLFSFLSSFRVYFQSSADLQLELLALRHQIAVLRRTAPKPRLKSADRLLWICLSRFWYRWHPRRRTAGEQMKPSLSMRLRDAAASVMLDP
jgi:hypothetical protein